MRLGVREIVPIVLLLVALGIAFKFLNPAEGSSDRKTPVPTAGIAVNAETPTPGPTETTPQELARSQEWVVKFVSFNAAGGERVDVQVGLPSLDFYYPGAPFNDIRDDAWQLVAEAVSMLPAAGRYTFAFEHDGDARLLVDGHEVSFQRDGPAPQTLRAVFDHPGGSLTLRIEVRDVSGALKLKFP